VIARVIIYEADIGEAPSKVSSHHRADLEEIDMKEKNRWRTFGILTRLSKACKVCVL